MVNNNQLVGLAKTLLVSQAVRKTLTSEIAEGRYLAKLAQTPAEVESALRLRYEVFNVELAAPNDDAAAGLEYDDYDAACKHLIVVDKLTAQTVGTYRLNSIESARNAKGFYAYNEFGLEDLPIEVLRQSVEVGRACVAREHRNSKVLFLLWKVLLNHLKDSRMRYFFGCCSLFTQDCAAGAKVYQQFARQGFIHPDIRVKPRPKRAFPINEIYPASEHIELPSLFNMYLKIGVKICGAPAIDREFGTIDFFVIFDLQAMSEKYRKMFLRPEYAAAETSRQPSYR
ncbi:MAG: GNAT family N-acetyltransferase [Pyrinomonadaceae bacterium]|nr:GNAT family N-acetyltransferase [Pyrinomonadaceae bacterium]